MRPQGCLSKWRLSLKKTKSKQAIVLFDTFVHIFYCSGCPNYHFFDLQACWTDRFDSLARVLFGFLLPLQLYAGLIKEWEMTGASKTLFSCSSVRNVFLWGGISRVIQWLQTFNGHCEVS